MKQIICLVFAVLTLTAPVYADQSTISTGQTWSTVRTAINSNFTELYKNVIVNNVADLKAKTSLKDTATTLGYYQAGDGGGGDFIWTDSDLSVAVIKDTQCGIYIPPTSSPTGANGAWVRVCSKSHIDARWFGLSTNVAIDNGMVINACISYLDTGDKTITGGRIYIPRGSYSCITPIVITSSESDKLSSLELYGDGMQNSSLFAATALPNDRSLVEVNTGTFCSINNLHLNAASSAKNALWLKGQLSGFNGYSHISLKKLRLQSAISSGLLSERGFLIVGEDVFSTNNLVHGFEFLGYHTSCTIRQFYATSNTWSGFSISDMSYSTLLNCASDFSGQYGYVISNTVGVNFINCGAESSQRSNFIFTSSDALDAVSNRIIPGISQTTLDGCFSFNGDLAAGGWGSGYNTNQSGLSKLELTIKNFTDHTSPNGISVVATGVSSKHRIIDSGSRYAGSANTVAAETNPVTVCRVHAKVITGVTTIANLKNVFGNTAQYSGVLHILASIGEYSGGVTNFAAYVLLVTKSTGGSAASLISSNGLTSGAGASFPSFTFSLDTVNNLLIATPIGSTSGTFSFYITQYGGLSLSQ